MKRILLILALIPQLCFAGTDPRGILDLIGYTTADSTGIKTERYRGDFNELSALASGDSLFHIKSFGYTGAALTTSPSATLKALTADTWTSSDNSAYWDFRATPVNTATDAEVFRIGDMVSGLFVMHETFTDPIAVDSNTIITDIVVTTGALNGLTTSYTSVDMAAQPVHPRVLSWYYQNIGKASTGTITFTGISANGDSISEDATLNGAACNKSNVLNNAFATLTSVSIVYSTHQSTGAELFFVGTSSGIGLANDVYYSTNTFKVIENGANVAAANYTIDPTYDTYLPSSTPNATIDYDIWYRVTKSPL